MKRYLKLLFTMLFFISFPIISNAASITLDGKENGNVAIYNLVYSGEEEVLSEGQKLEIVKPDDGLTYKLELNQDSGLIGKDSCNNLTCTTLIFKSVQEGTIIGTLTITNTTSENKNSEVKVMLAGNEVATKPFTLSKQTTTTTTTTTTTQKVLSSVPTLSAINISVGNMDKTFASDITEYSVTGIKDTINSITINPACTSGECKWNVMCPLGECSVTNPTGKSRITLDTGANKISIVVTSEKGDQNKTYILNVYRGEIVASSAYISDLKINDAELSPNFDSMTNDYTVTVGLDIEKLDIITTTEDPNATVVVKGNEKLKEGENTVTITVTSSDGESKQVYTILVNKEEPEKEEEPKEVVTKPIKKKNDNLWLIITISTVTLIVIIIVFIIIFKKKKKKNKNDNNKPNKPNSSNKEKELINTIQMENTETLNILKESSQIQKEESKQDIDEALDDLMKTKRLELGDLDF